MPHEFPGDKLCSNTTVAIPHADHPHPQTGKSFVQKRRVRYDEPGQARELTFSCYRRFQFLSRDRTRNWFVEALEEARKKWPFDLWAYGIMPEQSSGRSTKRRRTGLA